MCYQKYGCFNPHPNKLVKLPQSPSQIGTRFNLFTRNNRNSTTLIDDHNINKLTASHFKISRRTILVIHGFTGKGKRWWRGGGRGGGGTGRRSRSLNVIYLFLMNSSNAGVWLSPSPSITPETRSSPSIHLKLRGWPAAVSAGLTPGGDWIIYQP